jgi:hypothetical protein
VSDDPAPLHKTGKTLEQLVLADAVAAARPTPGLTTEQYGFVRRVHHVVHDAEVRLHLRHGYSVERDLVVEADRKAKALDALPFAERVGQILQVAELNPAELDTGAYDLCLWFLRMWKILLKVKAVRSEQTAAPAPPAPRPRHVDIDDPAGVDFEPSQRSHGAAPERPNTGV